MAIYYENIFFKVNKIMVDIFSSMEKQGEKNPKDKIKDIKDTQGKKLRE